MSIMIASFSVRNTVDDPLQKVGNRSLAVTCKNSYSIGVALLEGDMDAGRRLSCEGLAVG